MKMITGPRVLILSALLLLLLLTAHVSFTAAQLVTNVTVTVVESSSTSASASASAAPAPAPAPQCLTRDEACRETSDGCCNSTYCKYVQNTHPLRFTCAGCKQLGADCSGRKGECCDGAQCAPSPSTSAGYECRFCKAVGEECEEGSAQCCYNECKRSSSGSGSNSSITFRCTEVLDRGEQCNGNNTGTGTPCASGLGCEEREVVEIDRAEGDGDGDDEVNRFSSTLSFQDRINIRRYGTKNVRRVKIFVCVQAKTCVGQGGTCNNFLDGLNRCCRRNGNGNGTEAYCRNERGDGSVQIIGTCATCANYKEHCSSQADCCVERGDFCYRGKCRKCVRSGGHCVSSSDKCCSDGVQCERVFHLLNRFEVYSVRCGGSSFD